MVLFLDFDGVLHPKGAGQTHFTRLPLLELFLRQNDLVPTRIVITSTWREAYSLPSLRSFFSPDIAARIAGITPRLEDYSSEYERGEEVEAWLAGQPVVPWVALDDEAENYAPRLRKRLVQCDGCLGLLETDLEKMRGILVVAS